MAFQELGTSQKIKNSFIDEFFVFFSFLSSQHIKSYLLKRFLEVQSGGKEYLGNWMKICSRFWMPFKLPLSRTSSFHSFQIGSFLLFVIWPLSHDVSLKHIFYFSSAWRQKYPSKSWFATCKRHFHPFW